MWWWWGHVIPQKMWSSFASYWDSTLTNTLCSHPQITTQVCVSVWESRLISNFVLKFHAMCLFSIRQQSEVNAVGMTVCRSVSLSCLSQLLSLCVSLSRVPSGSWCRSFWTSPQCHAVLFLSCSRRSPITNWSERNWLSSAQRRVKTSCTVTAADHGVQLWR